MQSLLHYANVIIIEHDDTTDSSYAGTSEPNDDQPNAQTEQPEPYDVGMSWEQSIVISDCESEPDDRAHVQNDQCPRKVSESLQPNLLNIPDHPATRNETPHQPQAPMDDGPAQHPINNPNNPPATAPQARLVNAIDQYAVARTDARGWPPSVDELMNSAEHLELWTHARHPITGDPVFNPHRSRENADHMPKNLQSDFIGNIPV
jgi:hypothetical protein